MVLEFTKHLHIYFRNNTLYKYGVKHITKCRIWSSNCRLWAM